MNMHKKKNVLCILKMLHTETDNSSPQAAEERKPALGLLELSWSPPLLPLLQAPQPVLPG